MDEKVLFDFLAANHIGYTLFKHQPVFTVNDEPVLIDSNVDVMPGLEAKTLLLKDCKSKAFFLVSVTQDKRVDLNALSKLLGCVRFSFASAKELLELLKLPPGSVTPYALIFDEQQKVTFVLDEDFLTADFVLFHPLRNDMTIAVTPTDFLHCMEKMAHQPRIVRIPIKES